MGGQDSLAPAIQLNQAKAGATASPTQAQHKTATGESKNKKLKLRKRRKRVSANPVKPDFSDLSVNTSTRAGLRECVLNNLRAPIFHIFGITGT
jgi:hypothetical protein